MANAAHIGLANANEKQWAAAGGRSNSNTMTKKKEKQKKKKQQIRKANRDATQTGLVSASTRCP